MVTIIPGDCIHELARLPAESVHCCVTSPPYWGLRDYGVAGQLGLEATMDEYVSRMVEVLRQVRRVLRDDGTLWLNMGDCYASGGGSGHQGKHGARATRTHTQRELKRRVCRPGVGMKGAVQAHSLRADEAGRATPGLKPKDMVGIPWRLALALQADGWWLRQDIIWHKPTPMPESVTDRCTKAHEYLFLLAKAERYYFDSNAIKEPCSKNTNTRGAGVNPKARIPSGWDTGPGDHRSLKGRFSPRQNASFAESCAGAVTHRNPRSVWTVQAEPFKGAHFATFPSALITPCILAGCPEKGTVLDPFAGSGTTGMVAEQLGRNSILIELNPKYVKLIEKRTAQRGLFAG